MWHEARKQEKKIRCMLVDYQRRAQRRRDYYEKIKADPAQFLQLYGRPCKIHLDPAIVAAADSSTAMMPWQGDTSNMIDRFDVRAHLDIIPEITSKSEDSAASSKNVNYDERNINYERYRILVQNDFFGMTEDKFLHQIYMEEKFGPVLKNVEQESSKKKSACAAAIGYDYSGESNTPDTDPIPAVSDDSSPVTSSSLLPKPEIIVDLSDSDDSDVDLDLALDISKIGVQQANELNTRAHAYGMQSNDFFSFLNSDIEEAENQKLIRAVEEEKAMFAGRRSRKERRAYRERTLAGRVLSPPSYASKTSPTYENYKSLEEKKSLSRSKSKTPIDSGQITYITSFGGEELGSPRGTDSSHQKNKKTQKQISDLKGRIRKGSRSWSREKDRKQSNKFRPSRSNNRDRSHSRSKSRRRRSRSSRSISYSRYRRTSRSKERRYKYRSRSRSRSHMNRTKYRGRSRSFSRDRSTRSRSPLLKRRSKSPKDNSSRGSVQSKNNNETVISAPPQPVPTKRYYGRSQKESSSELSISSSDSENPAPAVATPNASVGSSKPYQVTGVSNTGSPAKGVTETSSSSSKLSLQERLKKKRQVMLSKQFKADKRAEKEKRLKMVQERMERAEEMKELSLKMKRRQRLRGEDSPNHYSSDRSVSDGSYRGGYGSRRSKSHSKSRSRSRSRSPRLYDRYSSDGSIISSRKRSKRSLSSVNKKRPAYRRSSRSRSHSRNYSSYRNRSQERSVGRRRRSRSRNSSSSNYEHRKRSYSRSSSDDRMKKNFSSVGQSRKSPATIRDVVYRPYEDRRRDTYVEARSVVYKDDDHVKDKYSSRYNDY